MSTRFVFPLFLSICCATSLAHAESDIIVQSLIMPAWVQHEGKTGPLTVGMALVDGDRISTGWQARVLLRSADGSDIKLGENATLTVSQLSKPRTSPTLFIALLDVAKGAFRFTTSAVAKFRPRDVTIRVADATIGIRGTDVWGKDGDDKRVVCLIEGNISVQGKDNASFVMDQPLTFFDMPKDLPAKAVASISKDKLAKWAVETEIVPSKGAATRTGQWKVTLLTLPDATQALSAYDEWRSAGYHVSLLPIPATNGYEYQLRITQLATRADAVFVAESLRNKLGTNSPKVSH